MIGKRRVSLEIEKMMKMKNLLLVIMLFANAVIVPAQNEMEHRFIKILPESRLSITGDTNINEFACEFNTSYIEENKDIKFETSDSEITFKNAVLRLQTKGFDCGNRAINRDFHALIRSDEYPEISLRLKKIKFRNDKLADAIVNISIAGKQKNYNVPVEIKEKPVPQFRGSLKLNINDFALQPPKKLFGLISVKDDIEIDFNLKVQH